MSVAFKTLPFIVRLATLATFFNSWVLFEELVIDRQGLDRFLPLYRYGELCLWDLTVAVLLVLAWWRLHK